MEEVLFNLSLIIAVCAVATIIARIVKQPPIIAYLLAGVIVGPLVLNLASYDSQSLLQTFSRFGVAFLLFIVGLSLDFRLLKEIGKVSAIAGSIEVVVVSFLGYLLATLLGFDNITSVYVGVALSFSSTVVAVKILSDKQELETLHGKIALGILIIQDILASIALMIIPLLSGIRNNENIFFIVKELGIAISMIIIVFLVAKFLLGRFMLYLAKSQEALFLFGIAWAFALATIFYRLGFSMEIGALIAGMSLASSKYALDLEGKMKPLRDFFVVLFFIFFGSQLTYLNYKLIVGAIILSLFVMLVKPIVVMYNLKLLGFSKKTNFLSSLSLAQVSEFSLILIMLGFSFKQISSEIMNLSVLVALITIGLSTYFMNYSHKLHESFDSFLEFFDGRRIKDPEEKREDYDIILFGYHRIGFKLLETLKKTHKSLLVVDYNPRVVLSLQKQKIDSLFGDAGNKNFLSELPLEKAKLIISTIPDTHSNLIIREILNENKSSATFIATAEQPREALELYEQGVDYVIVPHHLGGDYAAHLFKEFGTNKDKYDQLGKEHKQKLEKNKRSSTFEES